MKILIVDDERLARERLKDLLTALDPGYQLLEADNGLVALTQVQQAEPDIVLLDIRMPVMDGLETAYHLSLLEQPLPSSSQRLIRIMPSGPLSCRLWII